MQWFSYHKAKKQCEKRQAPHFSGDSLLFGSCYLFKFHMQSFVYCQSNYWQQFHCNLDTITKTHEKVECLHFLSFQARITNQESGSLLGMCPGHFTLDIECWELICYLQGKLHKPDKGWCRFSQRIKVTRSNHIALGRKYLHALNMHILPDLSVKASLWARNITTIF